MNEYLSIIYARILTVLVLSCGFPLVARTAPEASAGERPPNIVFILADDLGYGDLSCYGSAKIKTPHLDALGASGVRFTSYCAAAPVCTPSRAGLLTGRYPIRSGLTRVLFPVGDKRGKGSGIPTDEVTLAELLKTRGYTTACIGKWHLGSEPDFWPGRHGFDHFFGLLYSNDMNPASPLYRNGEVVEKPPVDQTTLTERYTKEAIDFIERSKEKPFFLYLPHTMPHVPLYASKEFSGKSAGGLYGDVVECIDWSVGEILKALDRLKLRNWTFVIFASDNGPWLGLGERSGSAGPLRDGKASPYEGGFRVPCIMSYPPWGSQGFVTDAPASALDIFPTVAALAGAPLPADRPLDGRDITGLLRRQEKCVPEFVFYYYCGENLCAVRAGNWKLLIAVRNMGRKHSEETKPRLYDLASDIGEARDVAAEHPDVVERLKKLAQDFRGSFTPPPPRQ